MNDKALMEFTSHITGKNAKVRLWPDRIEWELVGRMSTGAKAVLGAATMGMSLLATGVRRKRAIEAEEAADEKAVDEALKKAARSRCWAVEELYELLDIKPLTTTRRLPDGTEQQLSIDRDEKKRAAALVDAVVELLAQHGQTNDDQEQPGTNPMSAYFGG